MYKSISINKNKSVNILDQRLLPFQHKYIKTSDYKEVIKLIKSLAIRGAPAIGVAGAFACFFALKNLRNKKNDLVVINISIDYINEHLEFVLNNLRNECYLILSGVLFKDLKDLKKILDKFNISINKVYYLQNWITLGLIKNV